MALHKTLPPEQCHGVVAFVYADAATRALATGFVPDDVGKLARDLDNNSLWMLVDDSPITWKDVGASSTDGDVVGPAGATANAIAIYNSTTGKIIKNSAVTIDSGGNIVTNYNVDGRDLSVDGAKLDGIAAGAIGPTEHRGLAQLIHFVDEGPDSSAYKEVLPSGSAFPTSIIWWNSISKTAKIVEKTITWSGAFPSQVVWKAYSGGVVQETLTDAYDYTGGNLLTPKITRTFT